MEDSTLSSDLVVCSGFVSLHWHFILTGQVTCSFSGPALSHASRHMKETMSASPKRWLLFHQGAGNYSAISVAVEGLKQY